MVALKIYLLYEWVIAAGKVGSEGPYRHLIF
jgi:hypothetical protein